MDGGGDAVVIPLARARASRGAIPTLPPTGAGRGLADVRSARLGSGKTRRRARRGLASFVHLTALHVIDACSPAHPTFLRQYPGGFAGADFTNGFRPQETLTVHVLDAMVRPINRLVAGPQSARPFDFALSTGDNADIRGTHELAAVLQVFNGGSETEEAEEAVGEVMFAFAKAFASCAAAGATKLYIDDAEWLNAFGDWAQGRKAIAAKLEEIFSAPDFTAGKSVGKPTGSVLLLRPDIAVGWTYQEIAGQRVIGTGAPVGLRRNHSLLVLTKEQGQWLIAAQMFMDEEPHGEASATPVS